MKLLSKKLVQSVKAMIFRCFFGAPKYCQHTMLHSIHCLWKNKSGKGILQQIKRFCERQMFESVCLNEIVFMFISIGSRQYVFWFVFGTIKMGLPNIHDMIYNSHCQLTQGIKIKTCLLLFKFRVNVVFVSTFSFIMHSDQLSSRCLYFYILDSKYGKA